MIELPESKYLLTKPFLENVGCDTVVAHSIIEKTQRGRIFADEENKPTAALFWHYSGTAILSGDCNNMGFNEAIATILLNKFELNQKPIKLNINSREWEDKLNSLLENKLLYYSKIIKGNESDTIQYLNEVSKNHVIAWTRQRFHFNKEKFTEIFADISIPDGFKIKIIDSNLMHNITGTVVPSSCWDDLEAFSKHGFGYCLTENDNIASTAFTAFIGNNQIDIGIETNLNYRQRGLGVITAAYMVKFCLDNGYEPIWGCRKDNVGSWSVAKKVGFEFADHHPVYYSAR